MNQGINPEAPAGSVSRTVTIGVHVLSAWALLNILPALAALVLLALGQHAPGLRMLFAVEEIAVVEARALATVDGLAVLANTLIVVYCGTIFFLLRRCLLRGQRWSFFVLAGGLLAIQIAGYVLDHSFFRGQNLWLLNLSSLILLAGFGLCARGLFTVPLAVVGDGTGRPSPRGG